ncbi:MAG: hypothetical protein L0Y58_25215 [Verrucomicrobia subdivision 3 bacterium]|nr:hypothetical protein [Limisphaerales bacterium]
MMSNYLLLKAAVIFALGTAASAHAQGVNVMFCNDCLPSPPDRRVLDVNGDPLVGVNYVAQLYVGATPDNLVAVTSTPATFRAAGTPIPGTWIGKTVTVTLPGAVESLYMQVRVWDSAVVANYSQAIDDMTGAQYGQSEVFIYNPCDDPPTPNCDRMLFFKGFKLATNPPPGVLVIRENGDAMVDLLFKGVHTIEATTNLRVGPWVSLGSQTPPFTDANSGAIKDRFYRINDAGVFSQNLVGYYKLDICQRYSLIANQLDGSGGNTVTNLFKSAPNESQAFKYNLETGGYRFLNFVDGVWEGNHLDLTLEPGEGVFFSAPGAFTKRFLGQVRLSSSVMLPSGFSLVSSALPMSGPITGLAPNGMGFPIGNGDQIYQWDCANQKYIFNQIIDGVWEGDGAGAVPLLNVGEAFFYSNAFGAKSWNRTFTVGP